MAQADRVAAESVKRFQTPLPGTHRHGRPKTAGVMMHANALELEIFPVQREPLVRIEVDVADTKRGGTGVGEVVAVLDSGPHQVESGTLQGPEGGVGNLDG